MEKVREEEKQKETETETDKWQTNKANTLFKFVIKIPAYSIYYIWHNAQINMAYRCCTNIYMTGQYSTDLCRPYRNYCH